MKTIMLLLTIGIVLFGCASRKNQGHGYGGAFDYSPYRGEANTDSSKSEKQYAEAGNGSVSAQLVLNTKVSPKQLKIVRETQLKAFVQKKETAPATTFSKKGKTSKHFKDPGYWAWLGELAEGFLGALFIVAAIGLLIYGIWGYAALVPILSSVSGVGFMQWFLFAFNSVVYADLALEIASYLFGSFILLILGMALADAADSVLLWVLIGINFLLLVHMWPQFLAYIVALLVCMLIGAIGGY